MALKFKISKLEDVAEPLRSHYKEAPDGTGFVLDSEGDSRLAEFRDNNRRLHAEKEALEKKMEGYKGIDPEQFKRAQEMLNNMAVEEEKNLIKEGKIDEVVRRRTAAAITENTAALTASKKALEKVTNEYAALKQKHTAVLVDQSITGALGKAGVKVRGSALDDVLRRAREAWRMDDNGKMIAVDGEGKPRFGVDGDPLTMKEYVERDLVANAGHLFEGAGGGGAGGSKETALPGGVRVIDANDPVAMGQNLEALASGKAVARVPVQTK